jgi:hypothetical protein
MLNQNEGKTRQALMGAKPGKEPGVKNAATVGWFRECVHRSRNEIFSEIKTVTPAMAEVILSQNHDNRRPRPRKLTQMTRDMEAGRWSMNGEPIIVAKTGELNDGQHRLMALVDAKVSLPMLFVFGVDRETRTTVDQGANRSPGDYLQMSGVSNSAQLAAITRQVLSYEYANRKSMGRSGEVTAAEVVNRATSDITLATSTRYAEQHKYRMGRLCSATVVGFCHNILLRENTQDGITFMDALCTGENLQRGDAAFSARERLLGLETKSVATTVEVIFRAWNAYRERRQISKIPIHGRLPELV